MTASRILLIDDEPDLVWAVRYTLIDEGYEVLTAFNGMAGLALAHSESPDLIVLDIIMPEMDGVQVCHELRRDPNLASVPILFLSMRSSIEDRINGLNGGADDYLTKPFDFGELKARIRALLRRSGRTRSGTAPLNSVLVYEDLQLDQRAHMVRVGTESILLTPAEFDLLRYFMLNQGEVYSSTQLLQNVFGYSCETADQGLVRWHIRNIRHKIEPDPNHPRYVRTVPRHGYLLGDPSDAG